MNTVESEDGLNVTLTIKLLLQGKKLSISSDRKENRILSDQQHWTQLFTGERILHRFGSICSDDFQKLTVRNKFMG
ncbi:hypothetical protein A6R68_21824 [Neotoma lepida]|uniref:Uncharacterized protein n=1 Tax=Neotoma lepida TaxID=56216 RepID=A0A1A6HP00_NEOLE|nr:hypothetical protein A6R68_21824 [Neotoma lepida]